MTSAPNQSTLAFVCGPSVKPSGLDAPIDRKAYAERCRMRWEREYLQDALSGFRHFELCRPQLMQALVNEWPDFCGGLPSFLWELQNKLQPDQGRLDPLLDFCDGTQKVHLRRGLVFYCEALLNIIREAKS